MCYYVDHQLRLHTGTSRFAWGQRFSLPTGSRLMATFYTIYSRDQCKIAVPHSTVSPSWALYRRYYPRLHAQMSPGPTTNRAKHCHVKACVNHSVSSGSHSSSPQLCVYVRGGSSIDLKMNREIIFLL